VPDVRNQIKFRAIPQRQYPNHSHIGNTNPHRKHVLKGDPLCRSALPKKEKRSRNLGQSHFFLCLIGSKLYKNNIIIIFITFVYLKQLNYKNARPPACQGSARDGWACGCTGGIDVGGLMCQCGHTGMRGHSCVGASTRACWRGGLLGRGCVGALAPRRLGALARGCVGVLVCGYVGALVRARAGVWLRGHVGAWVCRRIGALARRHVGGLGTRGHCALTVEGGRGE